MNRLDQYIQYIHKMQFRVPGLSRFFDVGRSISTSYTSKHVGMIHNLQFFKFFWNNLIKMHRQVQKISEATS